MSNTPLALRPARAADGEAIARIYNHFIRHSVVTFEEAEVDAVEMNARIAAVNSADLPWLVGEHGGRVIGYAYAAAWRSRIAYQHSVESTIYLDPAASGKGLGRQLYCALLEQLQAPRIHAIIGGVALPNAASVALHESLGFVKVAHFPQVGFKFERWIDVGYWQLTRTPAPSLPG